MPANLYTLENTKMSVVILAVATISIIFAGGFGVFVAEHGHPDANITQFGDAIRWSVVTLATVGYGDYYPVTAAGRIIAIFMMIAGVGIFALMVATFAKRRLQKVLSKLGSDTKPHINLLGRETKTTIKNKVDRVEAFTEEDFDSLIVDIKSLRLTLLDGKNILKCSGCGIVYGNKPKFCSNCGLALSVT